MTNRFTPAAKPAHAGGRVRPAVQSAGYQKQGRPSLRLPLFLNTPALVRQQHRRSDPHEQTADQVASTLTHAAAGDQAVIQRAAQSHAPVPTPVSRAVSGAVTATRGGGNALPASMRAEMEARLGADFSAVRIHDDSQSHQLAQALGANAFTTGSDIYFNQGRYDPASPAGQRLLAHELTHVVQQGGEAGGAVQFDLMMTLPTALGYYEIEMASRTAPRVGMEGNIRFMPDAAGPYSTQIGLVQAINITNIGCPTPASGEPIGWSGIGGQIPDGEALRTTGADGAPAGWYIDSQTAAHPQSSNVGPNYIEQWGLSANNYFGWLRSPTDRHETSLYDYPNWSCDANFDFETVAKATDTQTVYGALEWGFQIRTGAVTGEYAQAFGAESATFQEALERFRGYFTHEPIVLYFDTDIAMPMAGELGKLGDMLSYLSRYPDVMLRIEGYADERGSSAHNDDLSHRRAENVESIVVGMGVDPSRIDYTVGWGETTGFSAGSPAAAAGSLRANRRVVISFVRTASSTIVLPP